VTAPLYTRSCRKGFRTVTRLFLWKISSAGIRLLFYSGLSRGKTLKGRADFPVQIKVTSGGCNGRRAFIRSGVNFGKACPDLANLSRSLSPSRCTVRLIVLKRPNSVGSRNAPTNFAL